ncbi:MAG: response regulator [Terracidiphilus sp.]
MPHRVLIADPHQGMRAKIRSLFENAGWEVVGEAADGQDCVHKAIALGPDLVVMELTMPLRNGLDAAAEIRKSRPSTKLLMISIHESDVIREEVLQAGVDGFAPKSLSGAALLAQARRLFDNLDAKNSG